MAKDIIYIDIEDDITAIIGKIKASREKIIALVPPKRIGALQSAVNLRLLARMAKEGHKHLVLITNNQSLIALSAAAAIPIAKNLQSKPEIAEIAALEVDDGEDVIDGAQLPVGELVRTADKQHDEEKAEEVIETIDVDSEIPKTTKVEPKKFAKAGPKVPDFSRFRKALFFGSIGGAALISFLVWAIWFAPAAKIIVTAKTTAAHVSLAVKLAGTAPTDVSKGTIQTITKTLKQDVSVEFTATGKKKVGDKATGTLTLINNSFYPIDVPSGTVFSNGSYDFVTVADISVPGPTGTFDDPIFGTMDATVTAAGIGADYNLSAGSYTTDIPDVSAEGGNMTGGSSHDAVVVTVEDIAKATQALNALSTDDIKQQLTDQFVNGETVISNSFVAGYAKPVSVPALNVEVTGGKAKLTSATTFTITAIAKSELETYLKDAITKQIENSNKERIYDSGIDSVVLSDYQKNDKTATVNIATTGKIGPNIDTAFIEEQAKGLRYGDVQALIGSIKGVDSVDVKFSYFWVNTVPDDAKKIDVEFILQND
ncbi:MAG: hypothetical protein WA087_00335 [Candidatus Saccharimonadales bacterium]